MASMIVFIKAMVRPYIIISSWTFGLVMAGIGKFDEIPTAVLGVIGAVTLEYGIERARKRLQE